MEISDIVLFVRVETCEIAGEDTEIVLCTTVFKVPIFDKLEVWAEGASFFDDRKKSAISLSEAVMLIKGAPPEGFWIGATGNLEGVGPTGLEDEPVAVVEGAATDLAPWIWILKAKIIHLNAVK